MNGGNNYNSNIGISPNKLMVLQKQNKLYFRLFHAKVETSNTITVTSGW